MSKKANPAMIGVFVVGATTLLVLALILFGGGQFWAKSNKFILYFEDSVNGLDVGAPVKFKGVDVGRVHEVFIHFDRPQGSAYIPVVIQIQSQELPTSDSMGLRLYDDEVYEMQIKNGLRASLETQSYFTGKLYIGLDYHPEDVNPMLLDIESSYKQIPTISSDFEEVWSSATKMFSQIGGIDFKKISDDIHSAAVKLDEKLGELDARRINDAFIGAMETLESVAVKLDRRVEPLTEDLQEALKRASHAFEKVELAAGSFSDLAGEGSSFRVNFEDAMDEVGDAAKAVRGLAELLERNPKALLSGKKIR